MEHMSEITLRVLAYQEGDLWFAQGVEYDILARAKTLSALPKAFSRAVMSNLCANHELGRTGLEGVPPAPGRFLKAFEESIIEIRARDPSMRREINMRLVEAA